MGAEHVPVLEFGLLWAPVAAAANATVQWLQTWDSGRKYEKKERRCLTLSEHDECAPSHSEPELEGFAYSPLCMLPSAHFCTGQKYWRKTIASNLTIRSMMLYIMVFFLNLLGMITFQSPQMPLHAFCTGFTAGVNLWSLFLEQCAAADASA